MVWCLGTDEAHSSDKASLEALWPQRSLAATRVQVRRVCCNLFLNEQEIKSDRRMVSIAVGRMTRSGPTGFPGSKVVEGSYTWKDVSVVTQMAVSALFRLQLYFVLCGKQNKTLCILGA